MQKKEQEWEKKTKEYKRKLASKRHECDVKDRKKIKFLSKLLKKEACIEELSSKLKSKEERSEAEDQIAKVFVHIMDNIRGFHCKHCHSTVALEDFVNHMGQCQKSTSPLTE